MSQNQEIIQTSEPNDPNLNLQLYRLLETVKPKNSIDLVNSSNQSISKLKIEKGEGYVKALLTLLIIDTVDFLSVGKSMSNNQVMQTVSLILDDYWHYKIDHFVLCFNKAKKGLFGKQYDRIDGQIIFSWLEQFDLEFSFDVESERRNESKRIQKELNRPIEEENLTKMPDWFADSIKKMNEPKPLEQKPIVLSDEQVLINSYIKEFDAIWRDQEPSGGKRFIKFNDQMLDVAEYIQIRLNEA